MRSRGWLAAVLLLNVAYACSSSHVYLPNEAPTTLSGDLAAFIKSGTTDAQLGSVLEAINHWPPLPEPTPAGYPEPLRRQGIPVQGEFDHVLVIGFDKLATATERAEVQSILMSSPYIDHVESGGCDTAHVQRCLQWARAWSPSTPQTTTTSP